MQLWFLSSGKKNHAYAKAPVKDKIGMEWKKALGKKKA